MMLLVAALTLSVSYSGYAKPPAGSLKKTGIFNRLGKGFMVIGLGAFLSYGMLQLPIVQRMTNRYEKLANETQVLENDLGPLAKAELENMQYQHRLRAAQAEREYQQRIRAAKAERQRERSRLTTTKEDIIGPQYSAIDVLTKTEYKHTHESDPTPVAWNNGKKIQLKLTEDSLILPGPNYSDTSSENQIMVILNTEGVDGPQYTSISDLVNSEAFKTW